MLPRIILLLPIALAMAPRVATILATELGKDDTWRSGQLAAFTELARGYLPT